MEKINLRGEDRGAPGVLKQKNRPMKGRNSFWLLGEDSNLEPSG